MVAFFFVLFWVLVFSETTLLNHIFRKEDFQSWLDAYHPNWGELMSCQLCHGFWLSVIALLLFGGEWGMIFVWDVAAFIAHRVYKKLA